MKVELYLSSTPGMPLRPGQELTYAGQFDIDVPPTINPLHEDPVILDRVFTIFNTDRPANYHGHSLSVGDVVTILERGFARSYAFAGTGHVRLRHAIKNGQQILQTLQGNGILALQRVVKLTTVIGDYKVSVKMARGALAPQADISASRR